MRYTAGIDVGSTYTKAVVVNSDQEILGRAMEPTGFKLTEVAERAYGRAVDAAKLKTDDVGYLVATGFGRHQVPLSDVQVTDLTASARGAAFLLR
jgi:activator of 2-hydroxyglutaryl-CoA dehydratase